MNPQQKKRLLPAGGFLSFILAAIFLILYSINDEGRIFFIICTICLSIGMLFNGLSINANLNKKLGYILVVLAIIMFCLALYTLYDYLK